MITYLCSFTSAPSNNTKECVRYLSGDPHIPAAMTIDYLFLFEGMFHCQRSVKARIAGPLWPNDELTGHTQSHSYYFRRFLWYIRSTGDRRHPIVVEYMERLAREVQNRSFLTRARLGSGRVLCRNGKAQCRSTRFAALHFEITLFSERMLPPATLVRVYLTYWCAVAMPHPHYTNMDPKKVKTPERPSLERSDRAANLSRRCLSGHQELPI